MKKLLSVMLMLLVAVLPCSQVLATVEQPVTFDIFISGPEHGDAIRTLIDAYQKVRPNVTIRYESTQSDYPTLLKTRINAGECPDIFSTTSGKEIALYSDYAYNLAGAPAANALMDAVRSIMSMGDEVLGFHYLNNLFGIVYNKEVFAACGIDTFPQTLSQLEADCQTIANAGYQPITTGFSEWWVYKHIFQHFINAASDDPVGLVADLATGKTKLSQVPAIYDQFFKLIDLAVRYGDSKPLETDLASEEMALASGRAAMMLGQGAWVESDLLAINPEMQIGFSGYPVSEDPLQCQVIEGPDQALRIYKNSPALKEVLDFVNWWLTSDYSKSWFSDVCHVIPAVKDAKMPDTAIVAQGTALIAQKGAGTVSISFSTDGFHQAFGAIMQAYVGQTITRDEACAQIEQKWIALDGDAQ